MKVLEFIKKNNLSVFNMGEDINFSEFYCGDLLSWVMGNAKENCTWFTIMNNINVCAVAKLLNMACVVICENEKPDEKMLEKAREQKITILGTSLDIYNAVRKFGF